jgi:hypothetical protein
MGNAAVERIYRSASGQDYPAPAQPNAFYSATTLQRVIKRAGTAARTRAGRSGLASWPVT